MTNLKRFVQLKEQIDALQRRADKAAGSAETIVRQLKSEFGVKSIEEAKTLLAKMERDEAKAEREYENALRDFEAKYGDMLKEEDV